jgi:hypothetical protein
MRIGGVVGLLGLLALASTIVKGAFAGEGVQRATAMLILAAMLALFGVASCLIQFYRAASIASLGESPFTVIPIVSIYFRLLGEVYGLFLVMVGVGSCLFIWLTGNSPSGLLGPLSPTLVGEGLGLVGSAFLNGTVALVAGFFVGFVVLLAAYLLAEYIAVIPDIARNVRVIVETRK